MSKVINVPMHTVVLLVGPSNSGKSYFSGLQKEALVISSDECRRLLIGSPNEHKYSKKMLDSSGPAFALLEATLKNAMSWPICRPLIIVDTKGISRAFRMKILDIINEYQYNHLVVTFDYKSVDMYKEYVDPADWDYYSVKRDFDTLKDKFYGTLKTEGFKSVEKITSKGDYPLLQVSSKSLAEYSRCVFSSEVTAISDIHGHLDHLKKILKSAGVVLSPDEERIIEIPKALGTLLLLGDVIDKGPQSKETLDFILKNSDNLTWLKGNHENFVSKYFQNQVGEVDAHALSFFDTATRYSEDPDFKRSLEEYLSKSYPFVIAPNGIFTHAPCERKYLGKMDSLSLKKQMRTDNSSRLSGEDTEKYLQSLRDPEGFYLTLPHVCGHISRTAPQRIGEMVIIDTGVEKGGAITLRKPRGECIRSSFEEYQDGRGIVEAPKAKPLATEDPAIFKRLTHLAQNGCNFISGTIAPAPSTEMEFESISEAVKIFQSYGVDELVIEKKFMGSRCTIYLRPDVKRCVAISRKGYRVWIPMDAIYEELIAKVSVMDPTFSLWIIDGELMPWASMAEGLIRKEYGPIADHIEVMKSFLEGFPGGDNSWHSDFERGEIFKEQLKIYGSEGPLHFQPFCVLKAVGNFVLPEEQFFNYRLLNDPKNGRVHLEVEGAVDILYRAFREWTADGITEGIVLKPNVYAEGMPPAIKVRNPRYLHLIYGPNFSEPTNYARLCKRKDIRKKLQASIEEAKLAHRALALQEHEIHRGNHEWVSLMVGLLKIEALGESFDPRL